MKRPTPLSVPPRVHLVHWHCSFESAPLALVRAESRPPALLALAGAGDDAPAPKALSLTPCIYSSGGCAGRRSRASSRHGASRCPLLAYEGVGQERLGPSSEQPLMVRRGLGKLSKQHL